MSMHHLCSRVLRPFAAVLLLSALTTVGGPAAAQTAGEDARTAALRARTAALAEEARRLEDVIAIHRLQRAYGYYIDKGYWAEAADLFADDATLEIGVDGVYRGKERIAKAIVRYGEGTEGRGPGLPFGQFNHHMQLQPVVTIAEDGRTAHGRWRDFSLLGKYKVSAHWGDATMENVYVKDGGVWKIQSLRVFTNFVAPYEGGWASLERNAGDWRSEVAKAFPPDAPPTLSYAPFPDVFAPPFHYAPEARPVAAALAAGAEQGGEAIAELEAIANGIAARLAVLASEREIENLQGKYGYYVDKGLWDEAASLFSADATYELGQSGVYVGRERVRAALTLMGPEGLEPGQLNNYPMLQPIITVAPDARTAKARWRSDVQLSRDGKGRWGAGVYENEYVNEDGVWRISKLHYYVVMWADYDKGWVQGPLPVEEPSKALPPDRPPTSVYESLPNAYVVPYHYAHPVRDGSPILPIDVPLGRPGALGEIAAELANVSARVLRLADQSAVEKLQRTYGYYVDQAMWHDVADLFAPDGSLEIGGRGVFLGRERAREYLLTAFGQPGRRDGLLIDHQQFQGIVTIHPDRRTAEGRWTAFVMGANGWGDCYYENEYVKVNGVWMIKALHGPFNMYASYDTGWVDSTTPNTRPESFGSPPDLPPSVTYLTFPNYYAEPFHYPNPVTGRAAAAPDPAAGGTAFGRMYGQ
ncbi:MAG TPA: nuclear transport factor 2 family protein [Gammaproteobacteria bacterium]